MALTIDDVAPHAPLWRVWLLRGSGRLAPVGSDKRGGADQSGGSCEQDAGVAGRVGPGRAVTRREEVPQMRLATGGESSRRDSAVAGPRAFSSGWTSTVPRETFDRRQASIKGHGGACRRGKGLSVARRNHMDKGARQTSWIARSWVWRLELSCSGVFHVKRGRVANRVEPGIRRRLGSMLQTPHQCGLSPSASVTRLKSSRLL